MQPDSQSVVDAEMYRSISQQAREKHWSPIEEFLTNRLADLWVRVVRPVVNSVPRESMAEAMTQLFRRSLTPARAPVAQAGAQALVARAPAPVVASQASTQVPRLVHHRPVVHALPAQLPVARPPLPRGGSPVRKPVLTKTRSGSTVPLRGNPVQVNPREGAGSVLLSVRPGNKGELGSVKNLDPSATVLVNQLPMSTLGRRKQNKKGKQKPKPRKGNQGGKGPPAAGSAKLLKQMVAPAVQYSGVYNTSPYIRFSAGSKPGGLRMHFRQRIARVQLAYDVSGNCSAELLCGLSGANNARGSLFICPANTWYFPDPISTFAKLFTKWRLESGCVEYVPRSATSNESSFTWGVSEDPIYPESHGMTTAVGGYVTTEAAVSCLPGATQFPCYIPSQCLKLTPSGWLYSVAAELNTAIQGGDVVSDVRAQYGGVLLISASENTPGTPSSSNVRGAIYFEGTLDFHELSATITADPSLALTKQVEQDLSDRKVSSPPVKSSSFKGLR